MRMTSWLNRCSSLALRDVHQARSNDAAFMLCGTGVVPTALGRGSQETGYAPESGDQLLGQGVVVGGGKRRPGGVG